MKRLILLGLGVVVLAAGTLLVMGPSGNHPQGDTGPSSVEGPTGRRGVAPSHDTEAYSGKRRAEAHDRHRVRAREIAAMPQDTARENAVRELAQEWVKEDPAAAERWARGLAETAERERALIPICLGVAERDPREALRIAEVNQLHDGIVQAIVAPWAGRDFADVFGWADELPAGKMRERMLARLIQVRAGENPAEAATMLSEAGLAGPAHEEAAVAIVHQWLLKDPDEAQRWVELLPEGVVRVRALGEIQAMAAQGAR